MDGRTVQPSGEGAARAGHDGHERRNGFLAPDFSGPCGAWRPVALSAPCRFLRRPSSQSKGCTMSPAAVFRLPCARRLQRLPLLLGALCAALSAVPALSARAQNNPNMPGYIPPAILHNLHMCGAANCTTAPSPSPPAQPLSSFEQYCRDIGGCQFNNTTAWRHQLGFGVAVVGFDAPQLRRDPTHNRGSLFMATANDPHKAEQEAMGDCISRRFSDCRVIARVANACTAIVEASRYLPNSGGRAYSRFYVSPAVPQGNLGDHLGKGGLAHQNFLNQAEQSAVAACKNDPTGQGQSCGSPSRLCARDLITPF
ncbi:DUF4189 domain-containing protein [Vandammella animalimorsus]|uniref:DUF4189 domain-containing protein n=2 Tax=Vandammella animalimorsus TaxID=2029117 RepID=A0A3M6R6Z2_9BURK|nr:DUF4189 domain-containing protein [Vandammella animalimorsus]